jgi:hypothetical protein
MRSINPKVCFAYDAAQPFLLHLFAAPKSEPHNRVFRLPSVFQWLIGRLLNRRRSSHRAKALGSRRELSRRHIAAPGRCPLGVKLRRATVTRLGPLCLQHRTKSAKSDGADKGHNRTIGGVNSRPLLRRRVGVWRPEFDRRVSLQARLEIANDFQHRLSNPCVVSRNVALFLQVGEEIDNLG